MIDRKDVGSWLSGPSGSVQQWPGQRLGAPESGSGSVARLGRRILALFIDWTLANLIAQFVFGGDPWAILALFALEQFVLVATLGYTIGHRVVGARVSKLNGASVGVLAALVRAVLLSLVIPAVVFDADQRGLHDRAMGTILRRA